MKQITNLKLINSFFFFPGFWNSFFIKIFKIYKKSIKCNLKKCDNVLQKS